MLTTRSAPPPPIEYIKTLNFFIPLPFKYRCRALNLSFARLCEHTPRTPFKFSVFCAASKRAKFHRAMRFVNLNALLRSGARAYLSTPKFKFIPARR
ncbi:MAG: hypothetical protein D8H92_00745 [Campylobacter sp.]|nr:MAG: hypothetical protein D8H92_00745 [Campylobacter sp.]